VFELRLCTGSTIALLIRFDIDSALVGLGIGAVLGAHDRFTVRRWDHTPGITANPSSRKPPHEIFTDLLTSAGMETRCQGANPRIHQIVNTAAACALGSKISAATNAEVTAPLRSDAQQSP
jgi:hypothetical protein